MSVVLFSPGAGLDILNSVVGVIGDNILEILIVVGAFIGILFVKNALNGAKSGNIGTSSSDFTTAMLKSNSKRLDAIQSGQRSFAKKHGMKYPN